MSHRISIDNFPTPVGVDAEKERVLAELREAIGKRIRPVLARMPQAEVDALIERMARIQLAYRQGDRRPTK